MTRLGHLLTFLSAVLTGCAVEAAGLSLRILRRSDRDVTVGNEAFSVTVERSGRLSALQSGGTPYVSFVALYTGLRDHDTDKSIRAVQGESGGGIGPLPESMSAEQRGERYVIAVHRTASRKEILDGAPLYELRQTVEVAPKGVVSLHYKFSWLCFCPIGSATVYVGLASETFTGLPYWADHTGHCERGEFAEGGDYSRLPGLRGPLRNLRVDTPTGPFCMWIDTDSKVTGTRWGTAYYSIGVGAGLSGFAYPGIESQAQFTIQMPLPRAE